MTDGLKGLEFYLSTKDAKAQAEEFRVAVDSAADAAERAGKSIDGMDAALDRSAKAQENAAEAARQFAEARAAAFGKAPEKSASMVQLAEARAAAFGGRSSVNVPEMRAAAEAIESVGVRSRTTSKDVANLGRTAGTSSNLVRQLLMASGESGAARGVGVLGMATRLLTGSMNPLGLAIGAGISLLGSYGAEALIAAERTDVVTAAQRRAQAEFEAAAGSVEKVTAAIAAASSAKQATFGLPVGDLPKAIDALQAFEKAAQAAALSVKEGFGALNLEQVRELGPLLKLSRNELELIEKAAKEATDQTSEQKKQGLDATLRKLGESNVFLTKLVDQGVFSRTTTLVMDQDKAMRRLETSAAQAGLKATELRNEIVQSPEAYRELVASLQKVIEAQELGNKEREVQLKLDELIAKSGVKLTDTQKQLVANARSLARAIDERTAAQKKATEAGNEAKQDKESVTHTLRGLKDENEQLALQGSARVALRRSQETLNALADAKVSKTSAEYQEALKLLGLNKELLAADEARREAEKGETHRDTRHEDAVRALKQEEAALRLLGEERQRYLRKIDAENELRQTGVEIGSAEYADYVRRKVVAAELAELQAKLGSLGAEVGTTLGGALEKSFFDGEKLRDMLRGLAEDLGRIAFRKSVTDNLAKLFDLGGQALANYFGGGGFNLEGLGSTHTGGAGGWTTKHGRLSGGLIPAIGGQVVDEPSFMQRAGRMYSMAEGGRSTPEAILPLQRDQRGRLGVASQDGGGGGNTTMVFPGVRNRRDAIAVRSTMGQRASEFMDVANRKGRKGLRP